jgi:YYY domain-containing protein
VSEALRVLALVELIGLAALPLTRVLFGRLPGGGLGLAKPLGLLLVTWIAWLAGSVAPYGVVVAAGAVWLLVVVGVLARWWPFRVVPDDPLRRRLGWTAEAVFLGAFAAMLLVRSFAPDVWGTEQPMDMALITTVGRSGGFPPDSPWLAGEDLDYYYLGHLAMAIVARLTFIGADEGYNVALALVFALAATATFSVAAALAAAAGRAPARCGLAGVLLVLVLGNLAAAEELRAADGLASYDWFSASRVVPGTINEFPAFSFVLGDLHAHVLALPFTLLAVATALGLVFHGPRPRDALAAGLVTGLLYAINAWTAPVVAGLVLLALAGRIRGAGRPSWATAAAWTATYALVALLAVLPFLAAFDQPTGGIGLVDERRGFGAFVADQVRLHGLLVWLTGAAFAGAVLRTERPLRNLAWAGIAFALAGSALVSVDLTGTLALGVLTGVALRQALRRWTPPGERAVWVLVTVGLGCLLAPEFVYVRDEFDRSELFRMNTVFKLGYEAWLLLGLAGAGSIALARSWLGRRGALAWGAGAALLAVVAAAFPVAAPYARTAGFQDGPRLDGLRWLARIAPGDIPAIEWLRSNAGSDAVLLESAGDDYSPFGHARMSTFTGVPAVLGWAGHELQWGHDPGDRRAAVDRLYRTTDAAEAARLLRRFGVRYVVVGPLERTDHGDAGVAKWDRLGRRVHDARGTTVWDVERSLRRSGGA